MSENNTVDAANMLLEHISSIKKKFQDGMFKSEQDCRKRLSELETAKNLEIYNIRKEYEEKIRKLEEQNESGTFRYLKKFTGKNSINAEKIGISLVQCFFGVDPARMQATARQLSYTLSRKQLPEEFIFVEAQKRESDAAFGWLKNYGVEYIFIKYGKRSDGLLLKTALWNVGAGKCKTNRLCFVDSDVILDNDEWPSKAFNALSTYDVASLSKTVKYEEEGMVQNTIGWNVLNGKFEGHVGMTLGMTRDAYNAYDGFEAFAMRDDTWIWGKIIGTDRYEMHEGWTPYIPTPDMKNGLQLKIGCADVDQAVHLCHGNMDKNRYELFGYAEEAANEKPFDDIYYDRRDPYRLPVWADSRTGRLMKKTFKLIRAFDIESYDGKETMKQLAERIMEEAESGIK